MHHISAQNERKHVLATSIFQNFLGGMPPDPPSGVKNHAYAVQHLTLCQQINLRALNN